MERTGWILCVRTGTSALEGAASLREGKTSGVEDKDPAEKETPVLSIRRLEGRSEVKT
jgi:hypothetical protein